MNEEVERTLRSDPTMASLVDRHGRLTVEPADDAFRRLCVSILNQQLSTASATAIRERDLTREGFSGVDDAAVLTELTSITGIGGWTARMYLLFALGREDVFPLGDLAVRRGIEELYADGEELSRPAMREIAEAWRPYRSYGTRYVWAAYESE